MTWQVRDCGWSSPGDGGAVDRETFLKPTLETLTNTVSNCVFMMRPPELLYRVRNQFAITSRASSQSCRCIEHARLHFGVAIQKESVARFRSTLPDCSARVTLRPLLEPSDSPPSVFVTGPAWSRRFSEQRVVANVAAHGRERFVARLPHDVEFRRITI